MLEWDERMRRWAAVGERDEPSNQRGQKHGGVLSVGQRLIEVEGTARSVVRNGFRIGGVEPAGLIEFEEALGRRPSRRQWRGSGGEIEIGEDGAYGNGIGDEGDDAHRSTAGRADERQHIVDASDESGPARRPTAARSAA